MARGPISARLTCKRFRCSQQQKSLPAQWRLFIFPFPYPLKNNFPLYDLHCVTTLRIQNYVDCNICVVPLLKASIRSTAPQTEQHPQSTEPLNKMPQCRKMSTWWKSILFTEYFYWREMYAFEIKLFKRKEERNVYENHFLRSYEIEKEDLNV